MDHIKIKRRNAATYSQAIAVIIPAYNEEAHIAKTLSALLTMNFAEIIVVDDASTDRTGIIAEALGVKLITHQTNKGKTEALLSGVKASDAEWLLLLDADLGQSAAYAECLVQKIAQVNFDMLVACLPATGRGGVGMVRRFAQWSIYLLTGNWLIAPLSGQRLIKREQFLKVYSGDVGFGFEVGLTLDYCLNGLRIIECEVPFRHRELGKTLRGFYHRAVQGVAVTRAISQRIKRLPTIFFGKLKGRVMR